MDDSRRISAKAVPADAVLPQARGALGLILLDTRFPRPQGDAGNPASWSRPVRTRVVARAWPDQVVTEARQLREGPLPAVFAEAVRELAASGVTAITTSCGFLVLLQHELQCVSSVPVVTSSLLLLPALLRTETSVGVLTISAGQLATDHFLAAGVPPDRLADVHVQGMDPAGEFATAILGNREHLDTRAAEREAVAAARALQQRAPGLRTLVLECTNLPPYRAAIEQATGWRVLSLFDAVPRA